MLSALEWTLSEKYAANFRRRQLRRRTWLKEDSVKENWFCFNQNEDRQRVTRNTRGELNLANYQVLTKPLSHYEGEKNSGQFKGSLMWGEEQDYRKKQKQRPHTEGKQNQRSFSLFFSSADNVQPSLESKDSRHVEAALEDKSLNKKCHLLP